MPLLPALLLASIPTVALDDLVADARRWTDRTVRVCGYVGPAYHAILYSDQASFRWGIYIDPALTKDRKPDERFCVNAVYLRADGLSQATARAAGIGIPYASHGPWPFVLRPTRYAKVSECCRAFSMNLVPRKAWVPRRYEPGDRPYS